MFLINKTISIEDKDGGIWSYSEGKEMNFEDFKLKFEDKFTDFYENPEYSRNHDTMFGCYVDWNTGGYSGGSCWGDKAERYDSDDPEPEFEQLDLILTEICPNVTFLQYKKICKSIIKSSNRTEYGYYGNETDYTRKYFLAEDLFNKLKEMNLI